MDEKRLANAPCLVKAPRRPESAQPVLTGQSTIALSATIDRLKEIAAESGDRLYLSDGPPHPDFDLLEVCGDLLHKMKQRKALLAESHNLFGPGFSNLPAPEQNDIRRDASRLSYEAFDMDGPISSLLSRARKMSAKTAAGVYAKVLVIRSSETGAGKLAQTLADDLINIPALRASIWPNEGCAA